MNIFFQSLVEKLRINPKILCLPEGEDERVLQAVKQLLSLNVVKKIKLFAKNTEEAKKFFSSDHLHKLEVYPDSPLRLHQAGDWLKTGSVDAVVAGSVHTTADVVRAILKTVGLKEGIKTLSSGFLLERATNSAPSLSAESLGTEYLYYADAGVVIDPTIEQLGDIAKSAYDFCTNLNPENQFCLEQSKSSTDIHARLARVAFLSFSTLGSARHEKVEKIQLAVKIFKEKFPDIIADGEMQFDAAFVPEVAKRKCPQSTLGGRANIFIFPNLEAANIAYKITERLAGFKAYGPLIQGSAKPFCDLSRGCSTQDIVACSLINLSIANNSPA